MERNYIANELANRKFNFIKNTIIRTIDVYSMRFDELSVLKKMVEILLESEQHLPPVTRLENLCNTLKEFGVDSYIIRKLHYEAAKDLEDLKNDSVLNSQKEIYWN